MTGQWHHLTDEEMETQNCTWLIQHHVVGTGWVGDANTQLALCLQWSGWQPDKERAQASENTDPPSNSSSATYSSLCVRPLE